MTQTKAQLILQTLQEMNVLGAGQDAPAEDYQAVEDRIQPLLDDLSARNVIYVPDVDAIDNSQFPYLVQLLAQFCSPKFEKQMDASVITFAENRLRTIARIGKGTGQNLRVDRALRPCR